MAPRRWAPLLLSALGALVVCLGPLAQGSYGSGNAQTTAPEQEALARVGSFELGKVRVLGVPVIMVAAPSLGSGKYQPTAEQRGRVIEGNLELLYKQLLLCSHGEALSERLVDVVLHNNQHTCNGQGLGFLGAPDDLKLEVQAGSDGSQQILAVLPAREQSLALLTVTKEDANLNGTTTEKLAENWRKLLQKRLRFARHLMQPEQLLKR